MKYLVTGGCGFLGSNIVYELLHKKEDVTVFDNLSRYGSEKNLIWLQKHGEFRYQHGDIRDAFALETLIQEYKPNVIFHLAGQVAMTTSIVNPRLDFEVNAQGSLNVLEAVRKYVPECAVIYSSTNKVYGDLEWVGYQENETRYTASAYLNGFDEDISLDFHSPYGCSKGAADQYMLDYGRMYNLNTAVFRHSSMYGGRQFATYDQGWVGWFVQKAVEIKNDILQEDFTISGNGKQVRDLLYADDCVELYLAVSQQIKKVKGRAFNIGGGIENSSSLLELFGFLEKELDIVVRYSQLPPRESDQKVFVADITKIKGFIEWKPKVSKESGINKMIDWVEGN